MDILQFTWKGVVEDYPNKTRLAKLLRFKSSNDSSKLTSLDEYIERMRDKQDHIYYMAGISMEEVNVQVVQFTETKPTPQTKLLPN